MTSAPRQHDQLSFGADRAYPRRRRFSLLPATVLVAVLAGAAGYQIGRNSASDLVTPSAAASRSATRTASAAPAAEVVRTQPTATAFAGPAMRTAHAGRLVVAGRSVVVRPVGPGKVQPVTGLPLGAQVRRLLPVRNGVLVLAVVGAAPDGEVFLLPDGTTAARPLGVYVHDLFPAATDETFWTFQPAKSGGRDELGELTSDTGEPVRRYDVPVGWSFIRGVVGGLLMRETGSSGSSTGVTVWDPSADTTPVRLPLAAAVVATSPTRFAWQSGECLVPRPRSCVVHVTELATHTTQPVPLPDGYGLAFGSFSPGGSRLALAMFRDADLPLYADGAVVDLTSGQLTRLQGASFTPRGSSHLAWTQDANSLVLGAAGTGVSRLAAWRHGDAGVALLDGEYGDLAGLVIR